MTCEHCGADLPSFALFCGECGRSVAAPPLVAPVVATVQAPTLPLVEVDDASDTDDTGDAPDMDDTGDAPDRGDAEDEPDSVRDADAEPADVAPLAHSEPGAEPLRRCGTCGAPSEPDDRFCADCGASIASAATRIIEPIVAALPPEELEQVEVPVLAETTDEVPADSPASPHVGAAPVPPVLAEAADESTRLVPRGTGGARFVLQFSTGETYTVLGSGLGGRNPHPEPGEYVDHLVTIVDPGRSVSKTHFEFGQEAGVFWFADRHSGNGSVIREPGAAPRPCVPGHRYPIVRGTRIDIGEQFVVVS